MTPKELVQRFYDEVFNGWDVSHIDELMLDSYKQHSSGCEDGKAGFLKFAGKFLAMKPHMDIIKLVCEGDMVVVFFKCTMADGKVNKVFDMYRVEDGKLAEHWDCVMHDIGDARTVSGNSQF